MTEKERPTMPLLKQIAARLPSRWQNELKRIHFGRQINKGTFGTDEPEYKILHNLITPGDWVVDIGANVGHYTKRFSELVGAHGRVIAFEPVTATFSLLAANVQLFAQRNVSLINAAVSDKLDVVGMSMPNFSTGLTNYYEAHISSAADSALSVLTISLDSLCINQHIALVKIDVEGHESFVLDGMQKLIEKHHPVLIVETGSKEVIAKLTSVGYVPEKFHKSPNVVFKPDV
ncbi:MAG: FkbM family methyltransferase [Candidatus Eisenbacteria sp.]|nr:FkbM family methyltransferase [Candidatus Eisenbacteria bacterium]